ncbi:MAG: class F sortase [Dehalococcoidia bacterium]
MTALAAACGGNNATKTTDEPVASDRTLVFELPSAPTASAAQEAPPEVGQAPAPAFPPPSDGAQLVRMVIPKAKVDAPLQVKGVNAKREMENPDGKDNVAWYNFSEFPGFGGNAVFSGHVDWYTGERGVFWYLKDLKDSDEIALRLSDGMELQYRVTTSVVYKVETAPVAEIVGPLSTDTLTLITCEGVFYRSSEDYSDRRVVRAARVG